MRLAVRLAALFVRRNGRLSKESRSKGVFNNELHELHEWQTENVLGSGEPLTAVGITEFHLENEFSK